MLEPSHHQALAGLFMRLFNATELRLFMRIIPRAADIYPHLPEREASLAELCFEVVDLLDRHGAIDADLFDRLREARPGRRPEIDAVADDLLQRHAAPAASPGAPSGPLDGATMPDADTDEAERRLEPDAAPERATSEHGRTVAPTARAPRVAPLALAGLLLLAVGAASVSLAPRCGPTPDTTPPQAKVPAPSVAPAVAPAATPTAAPLSPAPREQAAPGPTAPASPVTTAPPPDPHPPSGKPKPRDHARTLQTIKQDARTRLRACSDKIGAMDTQHVSVALHVDARGKIGKVTAGGTSYGDVFHACIARAVQTVKLPPGPAEDLRYRWIVD